MVHQREASFTTRYLILVTFDPGGWESASPEERQGYGDSHQAFDCFIAERGRRVAWATLAGADTATALRHVDGEMVVSSGPFVESVEEVGGYYDVELPDLDSAIHATSLLPSAYVVEIRPVMMLGLPMRRVG
ncbi:MAG: YciI family protein [Knoellia sp.]